MHIETTGWDFHRYWIWGLILLGLVTCSSCAGLGRGKPDTESVTDMATNCDNGMKTGSTKERGDSKESIVECFPPPEVFRYVR
jgi:hypothetical protein